VIGAFVLLSVFLFIINPIMPTDVKIAQVLEKNKNDFLGIEGFVGAGIARNESDNSIIGIAVYVKDNMINVQEILVN